MMNFTSLSKQKSLSVLLIFFVYYYNMVLLPLIFSIDYATNNIYENIYNEKTWYSIFGRSIYISLILTSFLPYFTGAFMGFLVKKMFKRPAPEFSRKIKIERKYALFLNMAFVVFTFGYHMPFLFFVASFSYLCQYILDKLLLTYWYEVLAQQSDTLNFLFIKILKYAPFSILIAEVVAFNSRIIKPIVQNEGIYLKAIYLFFFILIALDLYLKFFEDPSTRFARIYGENKEFLSRLSTL